MLRNLLVFTFCIVANSASAQANLGSFNVNPNTVTVAGISSGGFMAVQLQVAYSKSIFGTAVFAGGTYFCAQDNLAVWGTACLTGFGVPTTSLVSLTDSEAVAGRIDPVSNIAGKPIYMFSGLLDTTVQQLAMNDLQVRASLIAVTLLITTLLRRSIPGLRRMGRTPASRWLSLSSTIAALIRKRPFSPCSMGR
jgi:hypothetical protein